MYDYLEALVDDIKRYINSEINIEDYEDRNELEEYLNENLWNEDSVTGNASGTYTFNWRTAKEYVVDNMALCTEALRRFNTDAQTIANNLLSEEWDYFDVTIRCFLLGPAINTALDELEI